MTQSSLPKPMLTGRQKAAIVVRFLMQEGADINLTTLPAGLQANLTREIAELRRVDRETLTDVIDEFARELDHIGLTARGGLGEALKLLDGKIHTDTARKLRQDAGVRLFDDPWERIQTLELGELINLCTLETVEVAAVILSKLPVGTAAQVLSKLPGPLARRISFAISMTGSVTPLAVDRIGQCILAQIDNRPELAFNDRPEQRVAAILTAANDALRQEVLAGLQETDPEFAQLVEQSVFTFADIPDRITQNDIAKALKTVQQTDLANALSHAQTIGQQDIVDYILSGLSKRMAERIREEIADQPTPTLKEGEAAIALLVSGIQSQISAGELKFTLPSDDPNE